MAGALALGLASVPALSINDLGGNPIPNTSTTSASAQLAAGPTITTVRGTPFSAPGSRPSPNSPEEDLAAALQVLATTGDLNDANVARARAIDILEGNAINGVAYSGIALLNDNPAAGSRTKVVPANGPVVVKVVRFGEHQISDTWVLDFSQRDPNAGFEIEYQVTELGGAEGGDLNPSPLLQQNGTPLGGMHSVVTPLTLGETLLGTSQTSRFTSALAGVPGPVSQPEHTRIATQTVRVKMPPPKHLSVILDPNLRPGSEALSVLRPAGFTPTPISVGELAPSAPERQIRTALGSAPFSLADNWNQIGAQQAANVNTMRVKSHLPPGIAPGATDLTIAFVNNEVYVSRTSLRLPPGPSESFTVTVHNKDLVAHRLDGIELENITPVFGATNWGAFRWDPLGAGGIVAADSSATFTFTVSSSAFTAIIGDPDSGDQARAAITLDRAPDQQSFKVPGPSFAFPLHDALDAQGNVWVTLAGVDKIGRLTPASKLADAQYVEYTLPGPPAFAIAWEPVDIQVDSAGIVWATLAAGNAIMRLDPSQAQPNTTSGISIIPLAQCPETECRQPPPPEPPALSREPTQMTLKETPEGTEVWFTEALADKIGVVRWGGSPASSVQSHFTCACQVPPVSGVGVAAGNPSGIDVDPTGNIWFAGANKNTIARLTPPADPFATSIAQVRHFNIPSAITITEPEIGGTFTTSAPHSVDVDPAGRVWFTELALHKVGYLEPWNAADNTTAGMTEIELGKNDFGAFLQPADLVTDPAGTAYVADEYGDQITAVTRCGIRDRWRPTERLSFTDQPMVDLQGNLWFLEAGANLITRIAGVAAKPGAADSGAPCTPRPAGPTGEPEVAPTTPSAVDPLKVACAKRQWVFGTKKAPKVLLLGNTAAKVTTCLGKPTSKKGAVWTYGRRLRVTFKSGKVTSFVILNASFRSAIGNVGVGSTTAALAKLSTAKVTKDKGSANRTTVLPFSAKQRVRVQYAVAKNKVTRITVALVKR